MPPYPLVVPLHSTYIESWVLRSEQKGKGHVGWEVVWSVSRHVVFECLGALRLSEVWAVSGTVICRVTYHAPVRLLAVRCEAALALLVVGTVVAVFALLALVACHRKFEGCIQKWIVGAPSLLSGRGSPPVPTPRSRVLVPISFPSPWGGGVRERLRGGVRARGGGWGGGLVFPPPFAIFFASSSIFFFSAASCCSTWPIVGPVSFFLG